MRKGVLIILCVIVFAAGGLLGTVVVKKVFEKPYTCTLPAPTPTPVPPAPEPEESPYQVEPIDADEYYSTHGQLISTEQAAESETAQNEEEITADLLARGFTQCPIVAEYAIDGTYTGETETASDGRDRHPSYKTYYMTENGDLWTVISVNGQLIANPVSYNMQSTRGVQLVLSESETIWSYDSYTGKFYETVPNEDTLLVRHLDRIDAGTLENLTIEEVDQL